MSRKSAARLYRHFDAAGKLLYVGVAGNPFGRLSQHRRCSRWFGLVCRVDLEAYESREDALLAEREAIKKEKPKYNITHKDKRTKAAERKEEARMLVLLRTVGVRPLYSLAEAANCLELRVHHIRLAIAKNRLGTVEVEYEWRGEIRTKTRITGWQLLDYLESLEAAVGG